MGAAQPADASADHKLPGLQIARAMAALGIAYFHSWHVTMPFPQGTSHPIALLRDHGWIAVDFFFAISGFVICLVVTSPRFQPLSFMIRRAFRLYPLWIATSLMYLYLTLYLGRGPNQTYSFFAYSLSLLPTNGFPFYDLGWSLQHELAFYLLASLMTPVLGLVGLIAALIIGIAVDHIFALPWYLHQYFSYYGNFLAGIAAFLLYRRAERLGFLLPVAVGFLALHLAPSREYYPLGLVCWLVGFVNLRPRPGSVFGGVGTLLGDASYSIYLIHPLVFLWIYIHLQVPLPPIWTQEPIRYAALAVICAAAIASWMLFERPMIRIGDQVARFASRRLMKASKLKTSAAATGEGGRIIAETDQ
jgi:exopolysaccharide production protein ExoZ